MGAHSAQSVIQIVAFYFRCTLSLQQGKWNPQIVDARCRGGLEIRVI